MNLSLPQKAGTKPQRRVLTKRARLTVQETNFDFEKRLLSGKNRREKQAISREFSRPGRQALSESRLSRPDNFGWLRRQHLLSDLVNIHRPPVTSLPSKQEVRRGRK